MAVKRQRRIVFREHSQEEYNNAIRSTIIEGSVFWDYLSGICLQTIDGSAEFDRGVREGERRCAGDILNIAMSQPVRKEKENEED